jgi:queuosine precursor transporter
MNSKLLILLYLVAIVIANVSVALFGPWVSIPNALIFISLDLTSRDSLHELWHGKNLWLKMALLIGVGSLLSALLNTGTGRIALASCAAFAAAGVVDTVVYALLGERSKLVKMNGSNLFSGAVDSFVFPALAFGFPLLWGVMVGEFAAKIIGGAVWSWILTRQRATLRPVALLRQ